MTIREFASFDLATLARVASLYEAEPFMIFAIKRAAADPTPTNLLIAQMEFERFSFKRGRWADELTKRHEDERPR